ncbi:hypothetical protein IG193_02540 [Infirmifilum lucidum]|uniref:Uncharacterized protein n=1 Tax=Infirmifilum lucidum TaxID=2776706 RepID=A0A7L9FHX2_9CREN|nr:hypothetical protein [Infirmifilum lucidum]QOJ79359.1 hypothetical protein IG193_02540 [Infirmifilum lucidum]
MYGPVIAWTGDQKSHPVARTQMFLGILLSEFEIEDSLHAMGALKSWVSSTLHLNFIYSGQIEMSWMRYSREALLLLATALLTAYFLLFFTGYSEAPHAILADARNRVLESRGWRFREGVNCSDGSALVAGNVSLKEHKLLTSVTIMPRHGTPQAYLFYANRSASFVNMEGAWVSRGGGWRVEDTILVRLIDLALSAEEKVLSKSGTEARVLFSGTCNPLCLNVFNDVSGLAGSRAGAPSHYSGIILLMDRVPSRIILVFKGAEGSCSVEYAVFNFNEDVQVAPPGI